MNRNQERKTEHEERRDASIKLGRLWRRSWVLHTTHRIVEMYFSMGPGVEFIKSLRCSCFFVFVCSLFLYRTDRSFDALVELLREKIVSEVIHRCLQRIQLLCMFRHGYAAVPEIVNVRAFFAGFMIAFHPTVVFESIGFQEQAIVEVVEVAAQLVTTFEKICTFISPECSFQNVPYELSEVFVVNLCQYLKLFKSVKASTICVAGLSTHFFIVLNEPSLSVGESWARSPNFFVSQ